MAQDAQGTVRLDDIMAVWRRSHRASGCAATALDAVYALVRSCPTRTEDEAIARAVAIDEIARLAHDAQLAEHAGTASPAARQLPSLADIMPLAPRPMLVDGVLRQGEVALMVGATKSRKSWLAIDLCLAVAGGRTWLSCLACAQAPTVYIDAECPAAVVAERVRILEDDRDGRARRGVAYSSRRARPPRTIAEAQGYLADDISVGKAHLAVIDTLSAFMPIADENDNAEATRCMGALVEVADQYQCAILVVHHTPKQAVRRSVVDAGAGAGAYARRVDTCLVVREEEPEPPAKGEPEPGPTGRHVLEVRSRSCAPKDAITLAWQGQRAFIVKDR